VGRGFGLGKEKSKSGKVFEWGDGIGKDNHKRNGRE